MLGWREDDGSNRKYIIFLFGEQKYNNHLHGWVQGNMHFVVGVQHSKYIIRTSPHC
jgi:hypothetical protein